jgi:predicted transcriptional regulator
MSDADHGNDRVTRLNQTAQIVSTLAGNGTKCVTELTMLIGTVWRALSKVEAAPAVSESRELVPAVPIKKSVTPDFIVCLEDGKKLKMLKRHLRTTYGMSPADYRRKWGLHVDYPMVAPNYAATRSQLAKNSGLGRTSIPAKPAATKLGALPGRPLKVVPGAQS